MEKAGKKPLEGLKKRHIFFTVIFAIAVFSVFGNKGLIDVYRLRKERDGIVSYNKIIEKENKGLERQIDLLKTDRRYIGYIARKELGMIGRNEAVYKLPEEVKDSKNP